MSDVQTITAILTLLAGIGIFLVACSMMSSNLEALSSSKLRALFASASKSKLLGLVIGAVGTAAIQSSGATTVIAIGFVNAGIMSLAQAATVIYGANVGTTITGQIVAWGISGEGGVSSTIIFAALTGIGAFIMSFAKKDKVKTAGGILTGFGMLFVGLSMMSGAMESFANLQPVRDFLAGIDNVFLLVVIGAVLTAIIQSSSVMTSVAITMVVAGLINLNQGIYLTMGSNIGSCVVALIAGMTGSAAARRASLIHLIFNVAGVVLFMAIGQALTGLTGGALSFGSIFDALFPHMPQVQLAMFHTVFNVVAALIFLPLTNPLVAAVERLVRDGAQASEAEMASWPRTFYIDDALLPTPPIAIQQLKNEIIGMADIAQYNVQAALTMARTLDLSEKQRFDHNEEELDYLNKEIGRYAAKLFGEQLSAKDSRYLGRALRTIADLERVGDYAADIVENVETLIEPKLEFSAFAQKELEELSATIAELCHQMMLAYSHGDADAVKAARNCNNSIRVDIGKLTQNHVERIAAGSCMPEVGTPYLSILGDVDRVGGHLYNIAKSSRAR